VSAPSVEEAVVESIRRLGVQPEVLAETAIEIRQRLGAAVAGLSQELSAVNGRLKNLKSQLARLRSSDGEKLTAVQKEITSCEHRGDELRREVQQRERQQVDDKDLRRSLASFDELCRAMNLDEQRSLVRKLIEKVGYDRTGRITVSFRSAEAKELVVK
jgi:hypothetical protein